MGTNPDEREPIPEEPTGESIPDSDEGVGLGAGEEATTFEPEEDPEAASGDE